MNSCNASREKHVGSTLKIVFLDRCIDANVDSDVTIFKRFIELNVETIARELHISEEALWYEWVMFHDAVCYWLQKYVPILKVA